MNDRTWSEMPEMLTNPAAYEAKARERERNAWRYEFARAWLLRVQGNAEEALIAADCRKVADAMLAELEAHPLPVRATP